MRVCQLAFLIFPLLLPACTFDQSREFRIAHGTRRDTTKVRQIVESVAARVGLPDRTYQARVDDSHPLACFMDAHTQLWAYVSHNDIEIRLSRSDWPPPSAFRKADRVLAPALSHAFGRRLQRLPLPGEATAERIIVVY